MEFATSAPTIKLKKSDQRLMVSPVRIEICGGIGSGKTTLANRLGREFGAVVILEQFLDNPFWRRYYAEPDIFRPEKDVCFLAQHTGDIKATCGSMTVCDYAPVQDLAYARLANSRDHLRIMEDLYRYLYTPLPEAALLISLQCQETELLRRIRARDRYEERVIELDYLLRLDMNLSEVIQALEVPTIQVRSDEIDFTTDAPEVRQLLGEIAERFAHLAI